MLYNFADMGVAKFSFRSTQKRATVALNRVQSKLLPPFTECLKGVIVVFKNRLNKGTRGKIRSGIT